MLQYLAKKLKYIEFYKIFVISQRNALRRMWSCCSGLLVSIIAQGNYSVCSTFFCEFAETNKKEQKKKRAVQKTTISKCVCVCVCASVSKYTHVCIYIKYSHLFYAIKYEPISKLCWYTGPPSLSLSLSSHHPLSPLPSHSLSYYIYIVI